MVGSLGAKGRDALVWRSGRGVGGLRVSDPGLGRHYRVPGTRYRSFVQYIDKAMSTGQTHLNNAMSCPMRPARRLCIVVIVVVTMYGWR